MVAKTLSKEGVVEISVRVGHCVARVSLLGDERNEMKTPLLNESRSWKGHWWLPGDPGDEVAGVLTYEPGAGLVLELIGGFDDRIFDHSHANYSTVSEGSQTWPLVHGRAAGKEITLLDCVATSTVSGLFGGPQAQTVGALTALIGVHLEEPEQKVFTECLVSIEDLTRWSAISGFEWTVGREKGKPTRARSISAKPAEEPVVIVDGTTITLAHVYTLPFVDRTRGHEVARMRDAEFLRFQPDHPWSLNVAREYAKAFQDLLSLATHRACAILWLTLKMPREDREYPEDYPVIDREVEVYSDHTVTGDPTAKAVEHRETLFTCADLPFEEVVPRWMAARKDCEAASNMVLGLRYAPMRYIEGQLMTAVGAAEVIHRALNIDEPPIPADEFEPMRAALLEQVPQEHREWLKRTLRNDPTLRNRLLALVALPDQEAMNRLVPDPERWAKVSTRARNDLAHEGRTPKVSFDELIASVKVTSAVVVMNLLQVLGVPGERQRVIVREHPQLRQVAIDARKHLRSDAGQEA